MTTFLRSGTVPGYVRSRLNGPTPFGEGVPIG